MGFINEGFQSFKAEIETIRQEVTEATNRSLGSQKECQRLEKELRDIKREIIALKQYSRRNNIELKGVSLTEGEDVADIVLKVATFLKAKLSGQDVDVAHRVPTKGSGPPNIVVKSVARHVRDSILTAAKKNRRNVGSLGFQGSEPVYVNAHLCPENKVLLSKSIQAKKERNWKFAWFADDKVLMWKSVNLKVVHVTCKDDLSEIV
nr:uncharacterized protein LOC119160828 [Rhipicephalus microplus]